MTFSGPVIANTLLSKMEDCRAAARKTVTMSVPFEGTSGHPARLDQRGGLSSFRCESGAAGVGEADIASWVSVLQHVLV